MSKEPDPDTMPSEYDFSRAERGRYAGRTYVDPGTPVGTHVVLRKDVLDYELEEGDVGRLLGTQSESELKVEFRFASDAKSVVVTLAPGDLRLPTESEVLHVRETRTP